MKKFALIGIILASACTTGISPAQQASILKIATDSLVCSSQVQAALPVCKAAVPACVDLSVDAQAALKTK